MFSRGTIMFFLKLRTTVLHGSELFLYSEIKYKLIFKGSMCHFLPGLSSVYSSECQVDLCQKSEYRIRMDHTFEEISLYSHPKEQNQGSC